MERIKFKKDLVFVYAIWGILIVEGFVALSRGQWQTALIALVTFILTLLPFFFQQRFKLSIPNYFIVAIVFFLAATLFFGEASGFYEKFWWWDLLLHGFSAIGFGILGFVILLYLCQSSKLTASSFLISFFAFSFAIAIGALWEIFEYAADQTLGTNMQKSGLPDTMTDLIIDSVGALVASICGYVYLQFGSKSFLSSLIHPVLTENKSIFRSKLVKLEQE